MKEIICGVLVLITIFLIFRNTKIQKWRMGLKAGDYAKVFICFDEDEDGWFIVKVIDRTGLYAEVDYNVYYLEDKKKYLEDDYSLPGYIRIRNLHMLSKSDYERISNGLKDAE